MAMGRIKRVFYVEDFNINRTNIINEILENQSRANDHIFTKEKLEKLNIDMLLLIHEASKHMITK